MSVAERKIIEAVGINYSEERRRLPAEKLRRRPEDVFYWPEPPEAQHILDEVLPRVRMSMQDSGANNQEETA